MKLIKWIKKIKSLFNSKPIEPAYRSESDEASVEYYNAQTSYLHQKYKKSSDNTSDAMEP